MLEDAPVPPAARALAAALDAVPDHVVVLSTEGRILHANEAWRRFARENGGDRPWTGVDYLAAGRAAGTDGGPADPMDGAIRDVLAGRRDRFEHEYDCHAPDRLRWYRLTVTRVDVPGIGAVVAHTDVSDVRATPAVLGRRAVRDEPTGVLRGDVLETHARQMVAEGRGVTVVRVRLPEAIGPGPDDVPVRAAAMLVELFPAPAAIGRSDDGLVVVLGGASDDELLEALGTTYGAFGHAFPGLRVTITGERLSRGRDVTLAGRPATSPGSDPRDAPAPVAGATPAGGPFMQRVDG